MMNLFKKSTFSNLSFNYINDTVLSKLKLISHNKKSSVNNCFFQFSRNHSFCKKDIYHKNYQYFSTEAPKSSQAKWFSSVKRRNVIITFVIGSSFVLWIQYLKHEKQKKIEFERRLLLKKAGIGGDFELIDHNGKTRTNNDFMGKWLMIYFGFTHCPDICPEEMEKLAEIDEILAKNKNLPEILPVMITVDPDRDTVNVLSKYVKEFSSKIVGLTGTKEQIEKVSKGYHVYFQSGPKDEDNDYIVDHTINIYLVNPDGDFVDYYGRTKSADQIAFAITKQMKKFIEQNKKSWFG